jgi:diguanylate cyclase (GGDEF)-like protein
MGYRPDELGSLKFSQLVPAEELPHCRTSFQRLLAGEQLEVLEFRLLSRSGQVLDVEGTCTTSREHGQIVEICACLRNVTLRKRAERSADLYRRELEHANAQLRSLSITDPLTHLYNRRFFQQKLEEEYERSRRYGTPLALLLIDVDHFKLFNDTYGHLAGDSVLCNVADLLRDAARQCDIVARYGGEEFSVLSPLTNLEDAFQLAERLRQAIAGGPWLGRSVSVSIGVACTNHGQPDPANLIHLADEALYASKQHGRNRTTALSPDRSSLTTRNWPLGVENLVTARAETRGKSAATLRPLAHC